MKKSDDAIISSNTFLALLKERQKEKPSVRMFSGIPTLDRYVTDFRGGEVTIISGKTKHGKTTFAQSLTAEFAEQEKISLWFTFEVGPLEFLEKFSTPLPGFFMPQTLKTNSLEWVKAKIKETQEEYGLDAVFIDHLHYLIDMNSGLNASLEIGKVLRFLKVTAVEYNIAIFLLCHIQKMGDIKIKDVTSDHLRDSGLIACEADNVFFIIRGDDDDNRALLKITENRRNGVRNKRIKLMKIGAYLREVDDDKNH